MAVNKNTLKSWFKTGLKPIQEQFYAWMDSYFHKDEKIPIAAIENIEEILDEKANLVDGKLPGAIIKYLDNTTIEAERTGALQNNDNTTPRTFKIKASSGLNEPSGNLEFEIPLGYSIQNIEGVLKFVGGLNYAWNVFSEIQFINRTNNQDYIRFLIDKYGVPTSKNGLTVENLPDATNLVGYDKQIVVNAQGKFGKVPKASNAAEYFYNYVDHGDGIESYAVITTRGNLVQVSLQISTGQYPIDLEESLELLLSQSIPLFVDNTQFFIPMSAYYGSINDVGCYFYQNDEGTTSINLFTKGIATIPSYAIYKGNLTFINTMI